MKKILMVIFLIAMLSITACNVDYGDVATTLTEELDEEDMEKLSDTFVVCDDPYIRHGSECCLDQNADSICDEDSGVEVDAIDDALEDAIDAGEIDLAGDAEVSLPEEMGWVVYTEEEFEGEMYYTLGSCVDSDAEGRHQFDSDGYGLAGTVTVTDEFGVETVYTDSCDDVGRYLTEYDCTYEYDVEIGATRVSYSMEEFSCGMVVATTCVENTCTGYSSRYDE